MSCPPKRNGQASPGSIDKIPAQAMFMPVHVNTRPSLSQNNQWQAQSVASLANGHAVNYTVSKTRGSPEHRPPSP